jgi:uncharacterized protein with von Willebrand factor type A (vWA) domain
MKPTEIVVILDRSGSMADFVSDTVGGYNAFIKDQKQIPDDARLTTVLFDTEYEYFEDGVDLQKAIALTELTFVPRGMTALLDAIGDTIKKIEERQPDRVVIAIITDGQENSSHRFTKDAIKEMISAKTAAGWQINFLSANIDAVQDAVHAYGVRSANTKHFMPTSAGFTDAYLSMNVGTTNYRTQKIKDKDDK